MQFRRIDLAEGADLAGFRDAVRGLVAQHVAPQAVTWNADGTSSLFGDDIGSDAPPLALPRAVADLVQRVVCHRDVERYGLLYTLLWRVLHGEKALLDIPSDPLVHRLEMMAKSVRRDLHKMHAFVRFRRIEEAGAERFLAWFEPEHFILEATAPFFIERFGSLDWAILTPIGSLHWNREQLIVGPAGRPGDVPPHDDVEDGWRGYYESIFNPARVNPTAMRAEMPKKYWRNLPEARSIPHLVRAAPALVAEMIERQASSSVKRDPTKAVLAMAEQEPRTLAELNRIIVDAEPLVPGSTQAVLGEGPVGARLAFVGEQPGDEEDLRGRPFVGPAGQLLSRALAAAGIAREACYLTNAVKHFKFEQRGKRRIHQKPTAGEVKHYRWWLMKELELVRPHFVVALGATAALALTGRAVAITRNRGPAQFDRWPGYMTVHPSYLLRLPDETAQRSAYDAFLADLGQIRQKAGGAHR